MKLLYCGLYHDYGNPDRGLSFEEVNLGDALRHMRGIEVLAFHFDVVRHRGGDVGSEFIQLVKGERPDLTLIVLFEDDFSPSVLEEARKYTTLVSWGCDDHWRFRTGYMQRYVSHFDYCVTTYKHSLVDYYAAGQTNVIVSQWGCNPHFFRPASGGYLYDVSFVGQCYGVRKEVMDHLWRNGIAVTLFGRGWPRTRFGWRRGPRFSAFGEGWTGICHAEPHELPGIYSRSKINLCLTNNITGVDNIKGRNFEIPACRGFQVSGPARDLEDFFLPGKEIVVYQNLDDLVAKIRYYLENGTEREAIAQAGYQRAIRDHIYGKRFSEIFSKVFPEWRHRQADIASS